MSYPVLMSLAAQRQDEIATAARAPRLARTPRDDGPHRSTERIRVTARIRALLVRA
jgi:hypothetical protein